MSLTRLLIALVVAFTAGCATDVPVPNAYPPSKQGKLRATHHWDIVAADIAAQLQKQLEAYGPVAAVHLPQPVNRSPFEVAMHDFVITHLVKNGVPVDVSAGGPLQATLSTQLVTNLSERDIAMRVPLTAIAGGVLVAYNVSFPELTPVLALGSAAAYDIGTDRLTSPGAPSKTELIVTTSVANNARFLMRKTDVYYIDDADLSLFLPPPMPIPPTPTRQFRVQGGQ